jgi:hypothetical protein
MRSRSDAVARLEGGATILLLVLFTHRTTNRIAAVASTRAGPVRNKLFLHVNAQVHKSGVKNFPVQSRT